MISSRVKVLSVRSTIYGDKVVDLGDALTAGVSHDLWFWVFTIYWLVVPGGHDTRDDLLLSVKEFTLYCLRLPSFPQTSGSLGSAIIM